MTNNDIIKSSVIQRERERERDICLFNNKVFGDSQRHKFN